MSGKLDRTISVLNAIVGDYLRRRENGLEIAMRRECTGRSGS